MGICLAEAKPDTTTSLKISTLLFTTLRQHSLRRRVSPSNIIRYLPHPIVTYSCTVDNTTNVGFSFCEVSLSICPAEVAIDTATNLKKPSLLSLQTSPQRGKSSNPIPVHRKPLSRLVHQDASLNEIFDELSSGKQVISFIKPTNSFSTKNNYHFIVSVGSCLCEVSPSICPAEADLDTATLEKKSLLAEPKICCSLHNRQRTRRSYSSTPLPIPLIPIVPIHPRSSLAIALHYSINTSSSIHRNQVSENCDQNNNTPIGSSLMASIITSEQLTLYFSMTFAWLCCCQRQGTQYKIASWWDSLKC